MNAAQPDAPTLTDTPNTASPARAGKPPAGRAQRGIQSIEVGAEVLKALAADARPMQLKELVKASGMPSGKIHPYLVSFAKVGLVAQNPMTGLYQLGPLAIQLGLVSLQTLNPVREATAPVEALAAETGHSVAIAVWGNVGPVIVRLIDARYPLHTNLRIGTVMSLASTVTGRVFCAYMPRTIVGELLLQDRIRLGSDPSHPLEAEVVEEMIQDMRARRMGKGTNYPNPGVASFSAPVFDYTGSLALAVTVMGPTGTVNTDWDGPEAQALRACTDAISTRLGYRPK